jgi:hypothetical protein
VNSINKGAAKVAKAQARGIAKCIKDGGGGKLIGPIEQCITSDPKRKVGKAAGRLNKKVGKDCEGTPAIPPIDTSDPNALSQIMIDKELALIRGVFGTDLDSGVIVLKEDDKGAWKCQSAIARAVRKCQHAKLATYNRCQKDELKAGVGSAQALQDACLGANGTGDSIPDPKKKIERKCGKGLGSTLGKKCAGLDTDALFPPCAGQDLAQCLDVKIECEVCKALNALDGLSRDCDEFDDGVLNGSCIEQCGDGTINQPSEECDPPDDSACPGECQPNCTCPLEGFNCPQGTEDQIDIAHRANFDTILNRLLSDFWQENGDWVGDMMGDATTFAAPTLFRLGCMEGNTDYIAKAIATVDWGHSLLIENLPAILGGEIPPMFMETVYGAPALIDGYYYTDNEAYRSTIGLALSAAHQLIRADPDFLNPAFSSPVVGWGTLVYTSVYYSRVTGDVSMAEEARVTLDGAIARWWDEESGHFIAPVLVDWSQAAMLEALSSVYGYNGEESYRDKATILGQWVLANLKDQETGGFFNGDKFPAKMLSGNTFIAEGFLALYSATGDTQWLDEVEGILAYLLSEQIYDPTEALCAHHYIPGIGRADSFCTGCNFWFLHNLLRYSELRSGN